MAKTEKTAMDCILERQQSWAKDKTLVSGTIIDGKESEEDKNYLETIDDNLFQVDNIKEKGLREKNINDYNKGRGNEIQTITHRPKMSALHSSSALVVNLFQYWQDQKDIYPLLKALKLEPENIGGDAISFEKILQIKYDKKKNVRGGKPNIDVVIEFEDKIIAIESKFTEPYTEKRDKNSKERGKNSEIQHSYIADKKKTLWENSPNLENLAQAIHSPNALIENEEIKEEIKELIKKLRKTNHLDASQLIKHILGLKSNYKENFTLLYLWYDVPGTEGCEHRKEIEAFASIAKADGINFRHITYQKVIEYLKNYKNEHKEYIDYLDKRYNQQ